MAPIRTVIASRKFWAVDKDGREFELTIGVSEPRETPDNWVCRTSIEGLRERPFDIHGADSWQAMQLAVQFIVQMLAYFVEDGGRLFDFEERKPAVPDELLPRLTVRD